MFLKFTRTRSRILSISMKIPIGVTHHKKARKFKKPASPKLSTVPASPKEPTRKSKRVKRPTKKSSDAPTVGVVIRETHVKSLSKKKEKITVEKRKGIDFLSEGALTEEAYEKGSNSEHKTDENESGSESDQEENKEEIEDDKEEDEDEFVKTPSNDTDDEDETKIKIKIKEWIILPINTMMMWIYG
nr:hypothetical protein [Tanacetum cinerariifolium]